MGWWSDPSDHWDRRHRFVASGAIWFGLLALGLVLTALSSHYLGWKSTREWDGRDRPFLQLTITTANSSGDIGTPKVFLWPALLVALAGLLLALASLPMPHKSRVLWLCGLILN